MNKRATATSLAATVALIATLTGCGTGTADATTPGKGSGDGLGGTSQQQANREAHRKHVRAASKEVQAALAEAGITTRVEIPRPAREP